MTTIQVNATPAENKMTTAKVTRKGQTSKLVQNVTNYKGFLVQEYKIGVGPSHTVGGMFDGEGDCWEEYDKYESAYRPLFNGEIVKKFYNESDFKKKYGEADIKKIIGTEAEKTLIKWGDNDGLLVEDLTLLKTTEIEQKKVVNFLQHSCWETGLVYYELCGRYPENVFKIMKLEYHNEAFEEEGDWKGWYTMSLDAVSIELNKIGWKVN